MIIRPTPNFEKEFTTGDLVRTQIGNFQGQVVVKTENYPRNFTYKVRIVDGALQIREVVFENFELFLDEVAEIDPSQPWQGIDRALKLHDEIKGKS